MTKAIKFYADWCGPCKIYARTWSKVEEELKEEVEFISINVDKDTSGLAAVHRVRSIPHTVVIKDGETSSKSGMLKEVELKELINK